MAKIRNKKTGEIKEVSDKELTKYGLGGNMPTSKSKMKMKTGGKLKKADVGLEIGEDSFNPESKQLLYNAFKDAGYFDNYAVSTRMTNNESGYDFTKPLFDIQAGQFQQPVKEQNNTQLPKSKKFQPNIQGSRSSTETFMTGLRNLPDAIKDPSNPAAWAAVGDLPMTGTKAILEQIGTRKTNNRLNKQSVEQFQDAQTLNFLNDYNDSQYGTTNIGMMEDGGIAKYKSMNQGGMANVEVENLETIQTPDGLIDTAYGATHANGGIPMMLEEGSKVFSEKLKHPEKKKSFAKLAKKFETKKDFDNLESPIADNINKFTADLNIQFKNKASDELFAEQENLKLNGVFGEKVKNNTMKDYEMKYGGLTKTEDGKKLSKEQIYNKYLFHYTSDNERNNSLEDGYGYDHMYHDVLMGKEGLSQEDALDVMSRFRNPPMVEPSQLPDFLKPEEKIAPRYDNRFFSPYNKDGIMEHKYINSKTLNSKQPFGYVMDEFQHGGLTKMDGKSGKNVVDNEPPRSGTKGIGAEFFGGNLDNVYEYAKKLGYSGKKNIGDLQEFAVRVDPIGVSNYMELVSPNNKALDMFNQKRKDAGLKPIDRNNLTDFSWSYFSPEERREAFKDKKWDFRFPVINKPQITPKTVTTSEAKQLRPSDKLEIPASTPIEKGKYNNQGFKAIPVVQPFQEPYLESPVARFTFNPNLIDYRNQNPDFTEIDRQYQGATTGDPRIDANLFAKTLNAKNQIAFGTQAQNRQGQMQTDQYNAGSLDRLQQLQYGEDNTYRGLVNQMRGALNTQKLMDRSVAQSNAQKQMDYYNFILPTIDTLYGADPNEQYIKKENPLKQYQKYGGKIKPKFKKKSSK